MGICNFAGASVIFGSVCEMYCTKKITPGKNFSFSLHEQDQGAVDRFETSTESENIFSDVSNLLQ